MIFSAYSELKEKSGGIDLISCGHIFAKPGREILRPVGRQDWLLFYVVKENESFFLEEKKVGFPGSFLLYAPGERQYHRYEGEKTAEFYYVHFRCDCFSELFPFQSSVLYSAPLRLQICALFEELIEETLQKKPCYEKACRYRLSYLLTLLEREAFSGDTHATESSERIARALQHMNRFYDQDLKLEDYAAMCNLSKHHFLRVFARITGSPPLQYRNRIRLSHAAELLKEEKLSVVEVAQITGFSSPSYFSSAFKRFFGTSPKAYRNQLSEEKKGADRGEM